jgi:hypothetical protein
MLTFKPFLTRATTVLGVAAICLAAAGGASAGPAERTTSYKYATSPGDRQIAGEQQATFDASHQYATMIAPEDVLIGDFTREQASGESFGAGSSAIGSYGGSGGSGGTQGAPSSAAMDDYKGGPGCVIQCIKSGRAYARGVNAELVVHTDTEARIWISVWHEDGYNQLFSTGWDYEMSFSGLFEDLEPNTNYQAMATAQDAQGYTSVATGSFTTLTRNVELSFTRAIVHEAPYGNGPFGWATWANGGYLESPRANGIEAVNSEVLLGIQTLTFEDVQTRYLDFAILLWQSDPGPDLCGAWVLPYGLSESSSSGACVAWAPAYLAPPLNDLDARPADATSWTEHDLEWNLTMPGSGDLRFTVPVNLHVWYD